MRLAKLTLAGFKSFADKTEIPFDHPVVGIVGPNGCGKSNVVDAIKWVLGDQSPKSLRGGAMMDVIFNGSAKRKPAGMASVTLTFDNPELPETARGLAPDDPPANPPAAPRRHLPLDTPQVAVTRQLYRDGTSEYLVNNQRARLRDIRELFMDTGIGTDAYSIIEQGKVARMLEANAAERRQIFEEAAGVSRFKARKKEALRKLERTEQNLALVRQRLEDTEKRLRSVKMQAARARSFQEHSANLRALQLTFSLAEYHRLQQQLTAVQDQLEQAEADRVAAQRELAKHESALDDAQTERQAVASRSQQLHQARVQQQSAQQQAQQQQRFAERSLEDVRQQTQRDQTRLAELDDRRATLDADAVTHQEQVAELTTARAASKARLDAAQKEHAQLQHALRDQRASLEDEKNGLTDLLRRVSKLHNEITSLDAYEKSLVGTREKLDQRRGDVAAQLEAFLTQRDQSAAQLDESVALIAAESDKLQQQKSLTNQLGDQQKQLAARLADTRERRADLDSRRRLLQEMEDNQEGLADPVKALLAQSNLDAAPTPAADRVSPDQPSDIPPPTSNFPALRGLLADLIDCDVQHAPLVEAALGDHQQALVVDRLDQLEAAPFDTLAGRVTFLPLLSPLPPTTSTIDPASTAPPLDAPPLDAPPLSDSSSSAGFPSPLTPLPCLLDRVRYPHWLAPLVTRLLGHTYLVRDLDTALLLLPSLQPRTRAACVFLPRRASCSTTRAASSPGRLRPRPRGAAAPRAAAASSPAARSSPPSGPSSPSWTRSSPRTTRPSPPSRTRPPTSSGSPRSFRNRFSTPTRSGSNSPAAWTTSGGRSPPSKKSDPSSPPRPKSSTATSRTPTRSVPPTARMSRSWRRSPRPARPAAPRWTPRFSGLPTPRRPPASR